MKFRLIPQMADFALCWGPRYIVLMGGRGLGKTHALVARVIKLTTKFKRFNYLIIVPNASELGEQIYDTFMENNVFRTKWIKRATSHNGFSILLKNRSKIKIVSVARARLSLRGKNINELAVEECQNREYTEAIFERYLDTMVRGASPVGNRGTIVFLGQFGNDWLKKRIYNFGSATLDDDKTPNPAYHPSLFRSWRVPASEGFIYKQPGGPEDYARRRQMAIDSGRIHAFNQEYECIPTESEYAAFPHEQLDEISIRRQWMLRGENRWRLSWEDQPRAGVAYVVVADPGRTSDPTGIVIGDQFGNIVYEEIFCKGQPHAISARKAAELAVRFNQACLVCAANEFIKDGRTNDAYVNDYRAAADAFHLDFHAVYEGGGEKRRLVDNCTLALQRKTLAIAKECSNTLQQLKEYEYVQKIKSGGIKHMEYQGSGPHDDLAVCTVIYVEAAITREWAHLRGTGSMRGLS